MQRNSNCLDIQSGPKSKLLYCFFGPLCICRMNESQKIKSLVFTQCSICQKAVGVERWGGGVWQGCAPPHWGKNPWKGAIFPIPENFKIVHSGAISYTNFNVLFAIKCRERYVIAVFLATDGDTEMKTSSFQQSRKLIAIQSRAAGCFCGGEATANCEENDDFKGQVAAIPIWLLLICIKWNQQMSKTGKAKTVNTDRNIPQRLTAYTKQDARWPQQHDARIVCFSPIFHRSERAASLRLKGSSAGILTDGIPCPTDLEATDLQDKNGDFLPPPLYKTLLFIDREVLVIAMESHRQRRHLETSRTSCRNCFSKVKHTFIVLMYCSIVTVSTQSRVAHRTGKGSVATRRPIESWDVPLPAKWENFHCSRRKQNRPCSLSVITADF